MGRKTGRRITLGILLVVAFIAVSYVVVYGGLAYDDFKIFAPSTSIQEGTSDYGVSAAHPLAVEVGMRILGEGGNAVDAAIAVAYALGVLEPYGSGIGGGGAMLIYPIEGEEPVVFEYRESMPLSGRMPKKEIGIPGMVMGMEEVHKEFGLMEMSKLIAPAIQLAEEGFEVSDILAGVIRNAQYRMSVNQLSHYYPNAQPIKSGEILKQKQLAETLRLIQQEGADAFYKGAIAKGIAKAVNGIELRDLEAYAIEKKEPVVGEYQGYQVLTATAPLGGITLLQSLQMMELLDFDTSKFNMGDFVHLVTEISKRSNQDRVSYIGDPNFTNIPEEKLLDKDYLQKLADEILLDSISKGYTLFDTPADEEGHNNTTHFTVVDSSGMMVSATHTLSQFFGSGEYVEGFFMNNQLKNFSRNKQSPNRPAAGKSPRSYIAPTILAKDGKPVIAIGTPGGRNIPVILTQVIARTVKLGEDIQTAIDAPRFYFDEDTIYVEEGVPYMQRLKLQRLGYKVAVTKPNMNYGGVHGLYVDYEENKIYGGADARRGGAWRAALYSDNNQEEIE